MVGESIAIDGDSLVGIGEIRDCEPFSTFVRNFKLWHRIGQSPASTDCFKQCLLNCGIRSRLRLPLSIEPMQPFDC